MLASRSVVTATFVVAFACSPAAGAESEGDGTRTVAVSGSRASAHSSRSHIGPTSSTSSTSASRPFDVTYTAWIGFYPNTLVGEMALDIDISDEFNESSPACYQLENPQVPPDDDPAFDFGAGLFESRNLVRCFFSVYHADWVPPENINVALKRAFAPGGEPLASPGTACITAMRANPQGWGPRFGRADSYICGDADRSDSVDTVDVLHALRSCVGLHGCESEICDVDGDGSIRLRDVLMILGRSVGLDRRLYCEPLESLQCYDLKWSAPTP